MKSKKIESIYSKIQENLMSGKWTMLVWIQEKKNQKIYMDGKLIGDYKL